MALAWCLSFLPLSWTQALRERLFPCTFRFVHFTCSQCNCFSPRVRLHVPLMVYLPHTNRLLHQYYSTTVLHQNRRLCTPQFLSHTRLWSRKISYAKLRSFANNSKWEKMKKKKCLEKFLEFTFPWVTAPTKSGTKIPPIVAAVFVRAINVPAKLGAISMWLLRNPQNIPPMVVIAVRNDKFLSK